MVARMDNNILDKWILPPFPNLEVNERNCSYVIGFMYSIMSKTTSEILIIGLYKYISEYILNIYILLIHVYFHLNWIVYL